MKARFKQVEGRERESSPMEMEDVSVSISISKYSHSPAHLAVLLRDHASLRCIVSSLPPLPKAGEVTTEEESLAGELTADAVSALIDRRDVPHRETPLQLAVRLRDPVAAEILVSAGADWSLQNDRGWSALQEAVCAREEAIASTIARHYQPFAWAKWRRRLPRIVASIARIKDFYMEISFLFESSVIPFITRIAPSDTYRIWKRGAELRADMTLAGFDGFRIQRADQTILFLGEGKSIEESGRELPPGSLIVLNHKKKQIADALEGAGTQPTEEEVAHEVALMSKTNMYRPGIDVTQAGLVPHLNWRRQERTEMVGDWNTKVYDMLNVMVSVKSRRVPGAAVEKEELARNGDELDEVLTAEERMQLESALRMDNPERLDECNGNGNGEGFGRAQSCESNSVAKEKKTWFGWSSKRNSKNGEGHEKDHRSELGEDDLGKGDKKEKKKSTLLGEQQNKHESEYKKGLKPVLWLTPDFPLKTEELLPLLDVLANKVKAVRRLREMLTTKLPHGTFPVKIAIPIVPTIRVLITFTKFEELQPSDEFATPVSSPTHFQEIKAKETDASVSGSWYSWVRGSHEVQSNDSEDRTWKNDIDPFHIPSDYTWVDANEKKRRMKSKKVKSKRGMSKKQTSKISEDHQLLDGFE
ncbi:uncharacterized protein [Typha latifolia]|uniref:uncharacterized protein n=1 Tax=Typha latifolia TaxID=4733 RepID=UPI003C2B9A45